MRKFDRQTCTGPNCSRRTQASGLCEAHNKQRLRGKKLTEVVKGLSPENRFMKYVEKTDTCWLWTKSLTSNGYGQFLVKTGQDRVFAHRYSYEIHTGIKLTSNDTLDHRCRVRRCVNPDHLDRVSLGVNVERMLAFKSIMSEIARLRQLLISNNIDPGPSII